MLTTGFKVPKFTTSVGIDVSFVMRWEEAPYPCVWNVKIIHQENNPGVNWLAKQINAWYEGDILELFLPELEKSNYFTHVDNRIKSVCKTACEWEQKYDFDQDRDLLDKIKVKSRTSVLKL